MALKGPGLAGPALRDFWKAVALFLQLLSLEPFTYHVIIEGGYLKCLWLIIGVGGGRGGDADI